MAKERKKTNDEIRITDNFKKYIENYSARTNFVKYVSFYEQSAKEDFRIVATLDCGSFQQRIIYYSTFFTEPNFVDVEFSFENSEYSYMFYDIFNLFDIEDFNLYYYGNLMSIEDIENAVKSVFETTENDLYYLEKAGSADHLPELIKNYETDMDNSWGGYDWREEEKDIYDLFSPSINHPLMSLADGKITDKVIKKLKKLNEKGKLDTIYEKRLLKYIEAGNKVERKNIADNEEFEKLYGRNTFTISALIFAFSFVCLSAAYFIIRAIIFKGAVIYPETLNIFGKEIAIPFDNLVMLLLASVVLTVEGRFLFGKKLITKIMPEDMKNRVEDRCKKDDKDNYGKLAKPVKIIGAIIIPIVVFLLFIYKFNDVGYYDTYVRYNNNLIFGTTDVNYEDLEIYKVKYIYDEDDELIECENAYAISNGNGNYYDYGEVEKGGKTETKLKEIAEKYNKEIIEIDTIDELDSDIFE